MNRALRGKLHSDRGVNRLIAILTTLVVVLVLAALYPAYLLYKNHADAVGCSVAMKKSQDMLDAAYLVDYDLSYDEAVAVIERSKWEMETVCPAGGDCYVVERQDNLQIYKIVCGLHDSDTYERTRLNAVAVGERLESALLEAEKSGQDAPETVLTTINNDELEIRRLDEPNDLRYGTKASRGYKNTVAFYSLDKDGELFWFVYADPEHAAVWCAGKLPGISVGWSGDAFSG